MQDGLNAFDMCAVGGHFAVAEYLIPKMEDHLFDCDDDGYTALHWAAREGQLPMVEYLVRSCGFDLKTRDKVGPCDIITGLLQFVAELSLSPSIYRTNLTNVTINTS